MDLSTLGLDEEVKAFLKSQQDFEIDDYTQEGGNCDIFFGYHKILLHRVALKVYFGNDKNKSHEEARILKKLNHDNILKVYDAKSIGEYYNYFLTDEISGGDLEKYFVADKLDLKDKLNVFHGVLNGLTELHRDDVSILHRDLKPKNILIDDTKNKMPLIADFGSVKHFDKAIGKVEGSSTTLLYKPKEVVEYNVYSKQSDIHQVGVSMYQILGGYFPDNYYDWLNGKEQIKHNLISKSFDKSIYIDKVIGKRIQQDKLLNLETLPKYLDPRIPILIRKATHPVLKSRFKNTSTFMSELYKIQQQLTNWKKDGEVFNATKHNGDQYRVVNGKKGFYTEKLGSGGWRKNGDITLNIEPQFQCINAKK